MGEDLWLDIPSISQIGFLSLKTFKVPQHVYWYMFFSADCGGKQGCTLLFISLEAVSEVSYFIPAVVHSCHSGIIGMAFSCLGP